VVLIGAADVSDNCGQATNQRVPVDLDALVAQIMASQTIMSSQQTSAQTSAIAESTTVAPTNASIKTTVVPSTAFSTTEITEFTQETGSSLVQYSDPPETEDPGLDESSACLLRATFLIPVFVLIYLIGK